jgi:hypothetical protein
MRHRLHSATVKANELRPRLDGFGIGPLHFALPQLTNDAAVARQVLSDLEGRRVLYNPWQLEVESQCVDSVLSLRDFLSARIGELDKDSPLRPSLRQMRAACLRFLDDSNGPPWHGFHGYGPVGDGQFWAALGELRAVIGICVATIAERFDLDVDSELSAIIPPIPTDQD